MIENKFLYFQTYSDFKNKLDAGQINENSIAFIEDLSLIWTHGNEFGNSTPINLNEEDLTIVNDKIQFADKDFNPSVFSGLGRKYLRKNIVSRQGDDSSSDDSGRLSESNEAWVVYTTQSQDILVFYSNGKFYLPHIKEDDGGTLRDCVIRIDVDYVARAHWVYFTLSDSTIVEDLALDYSLQHLQFNTDTLEISMPDGSTVNANQVVSYGYPFDKWNNYSYFINLLDDTMVNTPNTVYVVQYDYDLDGAILAIPENCVLRFDGGSIFNGTLIGQNTLVVYGTRKDECFKNVQLLGTWISNDGPDLPIYTGTGAASLKLNTTDNTASGTNSVAEGYQSQAIGFASHAEGHGSKAFDRSHAEGDNTTASANGAHSEGNRTTASGVYSHAEGEKGMAMGGASHVEGRGSNQPNTITPESTNEEIQSAWQSQRFSLAKGWSSHVEGDNGLALADGAHAEGYCCQAIGAQAHAEGNSSKAQGDKSHSEGDQTQANNSASHSEGTHTIAGGNSSHAEGIQSTASSTASHAEGNGTIASGFAAHAEGHGTQATVDRSHAEGNFTVASGDGAHAEGERTTANGQSSHAEGNHTTATNLCEHAEGQYNKSNTNTRHSVGIGTADNNRKNAFEIMSDGKAFFYNVGDYDGTNPSNADSLQTVIAGLLAEINNLKEYETKTYYISHDYHGDSMDAFFNFFRDNGGWITDNNFIEFFKDLLQGKHPRLIFTALMTENDEYRPSWIAEIEYLYYPIDLEDPYYADRIRIRALFKVPYENSQIIGRSSSGYNSFYCTLQLSAAGNEINVFDSSEQEIYDYYNNPNI